MRMLGTRGWFLFGFLSLRIATAGAAEDSAWVRIFNGKDLSGWSAKFDGHTLGENPDSTFRVQGGNLFVNVHFPYATLGFGHLFYVKRKFSHYLIRAEYKFTQDKSADGFPAWTNQNNGLMLHSQDPKTMTGSFPNSIEVQLLGPKNTNEGPMIPSVDWPVGHTANMCSPGSFVFYKGADYTQHCTASQYPDAWKKTNIPWDKEWSDVTVRVLGDSLWTHYIRGAQVFEFSKPRFDDGTPMKDGYIAIQDEGTSTMFKSIDVLDLVGCMDANSPAYRRYFVKSDPTACKGTALSHTRADRRLFAYGISDNALPIQGGEAMEMVDLKGARMGTGLQNVRCNRPLKTGLYFISGSGFRKE